MGETLTVGKFIEIFNHWAPENLALEGDPVGLHFGSKAWPVHRIMITLDVRPEVVSEAIRRHVDFIFSHHPPIFKPVKRLTEDDPQQVMYARLIRNNIAVYAAHTNLDTVKEGMNDWLAKHYGLTNCKILSPHLEENYYRITTYVPIEDFDRLKEAVFKTDLASDGNYDNVALAYEVEGTFKPIAGAAPHIGKVGQPTRVKEKVFSFVCKAKDLCQAQTILRRVHPYEAPVIDIVLLKEHKQLQGMGRIGELEGKLSIEDYIRNIKEKDHLKGLRAVLGAPGKPVKKVAVLGGAGQNYYRDALKLGADTFITADLTYHIAHDMFEAGLNVIDPGHHMESLVKKYLPSRFKSWADEYGWSVEIVSSEINTDPFVFF